MRNQIVSAFALSLLLTACGGTEVVAPKPDPATPDVTSQTSAISECGGFAATLTTGQCDSAKGLPDLCWTGETGELLKAQPEPAADYCAAERLKWQYARGALRLVNSRAMLNCCGEHSVKVEQAGDTWVIREKDAPEMITTQADPVPHGARCGCMCPFDFAAEASAVPAGTIKVRLEREVTDGNAGTQILWSGELNLADGAGAITVDQSDASGFCEK